MTSRLEDEAGQDTGSGGWWSRGVTALQAQVTGVRLPWERSDGTFSAAATGTVPGGPLDALAAVASVLCARFGDPSGQNLSGSMPVVRWRLPDGTRLSAAAGAEGRGGTPVTLTHEQLTSAGDATAAKDELGDLLDAARPR